MSTYIKLVKIVLTWGVRGRVRMYLGSKYVFFRERTPYSMKFNVDTNHTQEFINWTFVWPQNHPLPIYEILKSNSKGITIDTPSSYSISWYSQCTDLEAHVSDTGQSLLSDLFNSSHSEAVQTPLSLHCFNKLTLEMQWWTTDYVHESMIIKLHYTKYHFLPILQLFQTCCHR